MAALSLMVYSAAGYEWTGESFLQDYYGADPASDSLYAISDGPLWAAPESAAVYDVSPQADNDGMKSVSGRDFLALFSADVSVGLGVHGTKNGTPGFEVGGVTVPGTPDITSVGAYPIPPYSLPLLNSFYPQDDGALGRYWQRRVDVNFSGLPYDVIHGFYFPCFGPYSSGASVKDYVDLNFDVSSFGEFSSFEFSGIFTFFSELYMASSVPDSSCLASSLVLFVNGRQVHTFYPSGGLFDFAHYWYDASENITDISFRVFFDSLTYVSLDNVSSFRPLYLFGINDYSSSFTVISDDEAFNNAVTDANNSINDYDQIESEWTANMNSSYDALHMDSFEFDNGLVSAFRLLTGIFQDIWTSFGIFGVLFTIPLILGIALLVIGRMSRYIVTEKREE